MEFETLPLLQHRDDDVHLSSVDLPWPPNSTDQQTGGALGGIYSSLPISRGSRSIRLLDIEASNHGSLRHICDNLRVIPLNERPRFTALSYIWGPSLLQPKQCHVVDMPHRYRQTAGQHCGI